MHFTVTRLILDDLINGSHHHYLPYSKICILTLFKKFPNLWVFLPFSHLLSLCVPLRDNREPSDKGLNTPFFLLLCQLGHLLSLYVKKISIIYESLESQRDKDSAVKLKTSIVGLRTSNLRGQLKLLLNSFPCRWNLYSKWVLGKYLIMIKLII